MSFAQSTTELFRGAATYVDKILKGAKPGDLPSRNPRFELIINLKTANMLGIEVPALVLQLADEVIE
jgi:putative ABC transport system substrate-binding protein